MTSRKPSALVPILGSLLLAANAPAITVLLPNGDFSSSTLTHGNGEADSLDQGWYAKNADDGVRGGTDPINWSTGATVGTAGAMTHLLNSGSKTRAGMYFSTDSQLVGTGWSFEFDLGGTGTFELIRIWGGTLAAAPSGRAFNSGGDTPPAASLVDAGGWTELLGGGLVKTAEPGHVVQAIPFDLSEFDVMVIKVRARSGGVNSTYDNFAFTNPVPEPTHGLLALLGVPIAVLRRRR